MIFETNKDKGRAGLSAAIAYFGMNGYNVSIPLNDTQDYDLVVEKDNIFQKERKMWIEYEGVASIGIDMSEIKTKIVGKTVTITMPKAKVLSIGINKETLNQKSYVYSSDGIIFKNKITTEEQEEGIKKGQETMQKTIEGNTNLFVQAESRAKELIENYINKLGDIGGVVYTINWK